MTTTMPAQGSELRAAFAAIHDLEVRAPGQGTGGDGYYTVEGYAAVYDQETTLWSSRTFTMTERIRQGAFARVLSENPDVHMVVNHDMSRAVARTRVSGVGGLRLFDDARGLRFVAQLDEADPDVIALAAKMRRGIVDQASFAFTVARDETTEIDDEDGGCVAVREIVEIGELFDVSVVAQGAYPQTEASLRSLAAALIPPVRDTSPDGRAGDQPAGADGDAGRPGDQPGGAARRARLDAARVRTRVAVNHHTRSI